MNIQDEVAKIHKQYGTTEMACYQIQLLFEKYSPSPVEDEDIVTCECGKTCPAEYAVFGDDGCWTCHQCHIQYLQELILNKPQQVTDEEILNEYNKLVNPRWDETYAIGFNHGWYKLLNFMDDIKGKR